mmetsp:Transcript_19536/g.62641  ORF Transcript_19536/g.62641 Transcript_19536/m.62641 type:complete len:157 (+) Transcript_19536:1508-1978(+)
MELGQAAVLLVYPTAGAWFFSETIFPGIVSLVQVCVTVALVVQVCKVTELLRFLAGHEGSVRVQQVRALERHLRFWVRTSILATCLQCIPSAAMVLDVLARHGPYFWIANLVILKVAKALATMAQIESFAPPRKLSHHRRVALEGTTASRTSSPLI